MSGITGELTEQRIFDHVATHLLKQGHAAVTKGSGICKYLTPDGETCAVGCLFSPGEYTADMEGTPVNKLAYANVLPARLKPFVPLLIRLQDEHDDVLARKGISAWVERMTTIACDDGLLTYVLEGESP